MSTREIRRNGHSNISALPSKILAEIFLYAKDGVLRYGAPKEAGPLNVAGVCRDWRNIALASPQMWSFINLSRPDCALELLKRSKSAPLQIHCKSAPLTITAANEGIFKSIMAEVDRIKEIDVHATAGSDILWLMSSNGGASAPLLEQLQLQNLESSTTSLPLHVISREMPSLRRLDLQNVSIPELPHLPRLKHLTVSLSDRSAMPFSSLLSSLRHSPDLEEISISGMLKNNLGDSPLHVKLPNLTRLAITSFDLEASAIVANLEYPPSAEVAFRNKTPPSGEPDLSGVVKMCSRLLEPGAPALYSVKVHGFHPEGPCRMDVYASYRSYLGFGEDSEEYDNDSEDFSISLSIQERHYSAACVALCSALPLETIHTLEVGGFDGMTKQQWKTIFRRCKRVEYIQFNSVPLSLFRTLVKSKSTKAPLLLPKLEAIEMTLCTFIEQENLAEPETSTSLAIFERFLRQRKSLKKPVGEVSLVMCQITPEAVETLEKYAPICWDGEDTYYEEDEDDYDYNEEDGYDFDDLEGIYGLRFG